MRRLIWGFAGRTYHIVEKICNGSFLFLQITERELKPGGKNILVTDQNKMEYLK